MYQVNTNFNIMDNIMACAISPMLCENHFESLVNLESIVHIIIKNKRMQLISIFLITKNMFLFMQIHVYWV